MNIPLHLQLNPQDKPDSRLFLKVVLIATDRPHYQVVHCMNCGKPIGSIEGAEIYEVTDVDDNSWTPGKPRLNVRCNGPYCRTWYRYTLN